ncbi:MAG: bifunctional hydroxymethylpyrimidine kinase/phosphomethylpyrimidine kinase [Sediminimonas sp.]|uniref:bifunctional hydroxymethylpyrimidine kinase/phosphomethylpyrimidine kinase n=1 Tax=Sediminimonas sp. TaxID=2823379 RepID=UPI00287060C5|nr:bifunctional hydroxymethylpyrimidine kinase/phosphomethylpyrimidine kinase [Sediminimonas sp.]MDR9486160.1 bifunctional hydroxymethylpyrimidine kinase/phosphomethylpyrimidine kinase [Sediminimonas sp.]
MGNISRILVIAGSDSGGGAGIQADIKAASALGVYAATAITAITAQNTTGVQAARMLPPGLVSAQIASVLADIEVDAVKIGMLGDAGIIEAVAEALSGYEGPIVLDPVMVAKSGDALLADDAVAALARTLVPRATILTPNLPEAARLLRREEADTPGAVEAQGSALRDMGAREVLMKGGHAAGPVCRDALISAAGTAVFEAPRLSTRNTHGTGCSLSSAIAAELAKGAAPQDAVGRAHGWLHGAIAAADALGVGRGHGPVHHFHEVWT